jgi:hypothetical protein
VTTPVELTDATEKSELVHAKTRPSSGLRFASSAAADSVTDAPLASVADGGDTVTLDIGDGPVGLSEHDRRDAQRSVTTTTLARNRARIQGQ